MKPNIDVIDYFLIGSGILLLPAFGIGLIPIGIAIFRMGQKMENHQEETDRELKKYDKEIEELENKFKIDYIDEGVLRELK